MGIIGLGLADDGHKRSPVSGAYLRPLPSSYLNHRLSALPILYTERKVPTPRRNCLCKKVGKNIAYFYSDRLSPFNTLLQQGRKASVVHLSVLPDRNSR